MRLWELGVIYDVVRSVNSGSLDVNYADLGSKQSNASSAIAMLSGKLDLEPGRVTWVRYIQSICMELSNAFADGS